MASSHSIKIHDHCLIPPPPSSTHFSLPLTFFDMFWLRFHPVERIFFYSLPPPHSQPHFFFDQLVPNLKTSLSHTLQHFLPLAGNIVWPSESESPIIQFNPGDGVSMVLAEYDDVGEEEFNQILQHNSPREAQESRKLVPHLESSDSHASVLSLQITLFRNRGFSIGISTHHAVLDGKSSTLFVKAWALACKSGEYLPKFEPFLDREVIKDPSGLGNLFINSWKQISSKLDTSGNNNSSERSLKIMSNSNPSQEIYEGKTRATFELTREDMEKIKKRVLSMWNKVDEEQEKAEQPMIDSSKPTTLSTFIITCAYVSVCIAKAIQESEKGKEKVHKFLIGFTMDCRNQLKPPIPENYFGNCVASHIVDSADDSEEFTKEDGVVIVAKNIHRKIKMLQHKQGPLDGVETVMDRFMSLASKGIIGIGVAGSNRFGVYETDFGWGRPEKVEITSVDRNLTIAMAESKDGKGGVEVGLVLDKHVMGFFCTFFQEGLCYE